MKLQVKTTEIFEGYGKVINNGDGWFFCHGEKQINLGNLALTPSISYNAKLTNGTLSIERFASLVNFSDYTKTSAIKLTALAESNLFSVALTDENSLSGVVEFSKLKKEGAILGTVLGGYTILAKNYNGYKNLCALYSEAHKNKLVPVLSFSLLKKYSEGIIVLSGYGKSSFYENVSKGELEQAKEKATALKSVFGDDFYLEVQSHTIYQEELLNNNIALIGQELGIKVVATVGSRYTTEFDFEVYHARVCIANKDLLSNPSTKPSGSMFHLMTSEDMEELFSDNLQWVENTLEVAEKCDFKIKKQEYKMPVCEISNGFTSFSDYVHSLFEKKFFHLTGDKKARYLKRLEEELSVLSNMGFEGYFLIVADVLRFARENGILYGPGRGSAAGSLVVYLLEITKVEPLDYGLLFERFLNPGRRDMPDIDLDFQNDKRPIIINYLSTKYGVDCVSNIITFATSGAKGSVKDATRVLGHAPSLGDKISKMLTGETLSVEISNNRDLKSWMDTDFEVQQVLELAMKLEGLIRGTSQHACGILISPHALSSDIPVVYAEGEDGNLIPVSGYIYPECEAQGILKFDILGIKTLTAVSECCKMVGINPDNIPHGDAKTYELLENGTTGGIFQVESPGMTKVMMEICKNNHTVEGLSAGISLYRPGPLEYIPLYNKNMNNPEGVTYVDPRLEDILKPTYGVIVYQEQVMQIVKTLGGFSGGRADDVRKAMGKKKIDVMEKEREVFIYGNKSAFESGNDSSYACGCLANGVSEEIAILLWDQMAEFAKYAFNKSHAICYSVVTYTTAYLSTHYPAYFMAAMLNAYTGSSDQIKRLFKASSTRGVKLENPTVNINTGKFTVKDSNTIVYGLETVVGVKSKATIISAEVRERGPFSGVSDFCERISKRTNKKGLGKAIVKSLANAGAFDCFGLNRKEALLNVEEGFLAASKESNVDPNQLSLFKALPTVDPTVRVEEYPIETLLENEYLSLNAYISGHPVNSWYDSLSADDKANIMLVDSLTEEHKEFRQITVVGQVRDYSAMYTKKGDLMYKFSLRTQYADIPCVIFPKDAQKMTHIINDNDVIIVECRYSGNEDFGDQLIVSLVTPCNTVTQSKTNGKNLIIEVSSKEAQTEVLKICSLCQGDSQVFLKASGSDAIYTISQKVELTASLFEKLGGFVHYFA